MQFIGINSIHKVKVCSCFQSFVTTPVGHSAPTKHSLPVPLPQPQVTSVVISGSVFTQVESRRVCPSAADFLPQPASCSRCPNSAPRCGGVVFSRVDGPGFVCHSSVPGHVSGSHVLGIVSNAAVNMGEHVTLPVPTPSSFRCAPRSGIAGSHANSRCRFLRNRRTVFTAAAPCDIAANGAQGLQGLRFLTSACDSLVLILAVPVGADWCLTVALVCIPW